MVTLKVVTISSFVPSPSCRCGDIQSSFDPIPHVVVVALKAMAISFLLPAKRRYLHANHGNLTVQSD